MSRRRRRVPEAGPVRKTVEVVVSALFGMGVVAVILVLLQGGPSPASQGPEPTVGSTAGYDGGSDGGDGGLGIRSADPGTPGPTTGTVYSAQPAPTPTGPSEAGSAAQQTGSTEPATPTPTASGGTGSASGSASPSASASSGTGALGGVVGGLVGGVLGLL